MDFGTRVEKFLANGWPVSRAQLLAYGRNLKKKYGISLEEYLWKFDAQDGKCGICGEDKQYNLHVDHDHNTGRVRGLLCFHCNAGLGHFRDDRDKVLAAADYLNRYE